MADGASESERESLAHLVSDYRRALAALQDLTEEFAARLRDGTTDRANGSDVPIDATRDGVLEIRCLGSFSVRLDGRLVELPVSGRPAAILKVLADRGGRPLSRDQLIELLWPGVSTDAGANRLRVAVHTLRQAFSEGLDLVSYEAGAYRLNAERIEIDAEQFETLIADARARSAAGDDEGARRAYEAAERLYGGDYFQDDPFEEWATTRRQHLRDLYLNLLVKLAILAMERADYDACVAYGHAIVREDALSEDAYRLLMLAHARLGNRPRALRWYDLCKQALMRELSLGPSAATEQLREEILSEEPAVGRSVRERLGLGAIGGLVAALGGVTASQKIAVAVAVAAFALVAGGGQPSQPRVSFRAAEAAERPPYRLELPEVASPSKWLDVVSALSGPSGPAAGAPVHQGVPSGASTGDAGADEPWRAGTPSVVVDELIPEASAASGTPANVSGPGDPKGLPPQAAGGTGPSSAAPATQAGPPEHAGPNDGQGNAPAHAGPPDQAGPKDVVGGGPPEWAGPPDHAGPKPDQGNAPEQAGPPDQAGPKNEVGGGPPVWAGPPPDPGLTTNGGPMNGTAAGASASRSPANAGSGQGGASAQAGPPEFAGSQGNAASDVSVAANPSRGSAGNAPPNAAHGASGGSGGNGNGSGKK